MNDFMNWLWERDEALTVILLLIICIGMLFLIILALMYNSWLVIGLFFVGVATWTWVRWTEYKEEKHRD